MSAGRPVTKSGMVGPGAMGRPIAGPIARAGFDVVGYDTATDRVPVDPE
jgi:3-hydroxyisobutyrate dehydrogenase-like beta-hydroxyacid dehydrogenase